MSALNALNSLQRQHGYNQQKSLGTWSGNAQHKNLLPGYKQPTPVQPVKQVALVRRAPAASGRPVNMGTLNNLNPNMQGYYKNTQPMQRQQGQQGRLDIMSPTINNQGQYNTGNQQIDYNNLLQMLMRSGNFGAY